MLKAAPKERYDVIGMGLQRLGQSDLQTRGGEGGRGRAVRERPDGVCVCASVSLCFVDLCVSVFASVPASLR